MKSRLRTIAILPWLGWLCLPPCSLCQSQPSEAAVGRPLNLAVFTSGAVTFKRQGWTTYVPVAFGTNVQLGDLLSVGDSSQLKLVCSDLSLHDVAPGISGMPCPLAPGFIQEPNGSLINQTRGRIVGGSGPRVLSPRRTKLLSAHPLLRWAPVEGANQYTVTVRGYNLVWSFSVYGVTEITYPPFAPVLKPGVDYKLIVQAGNASSDEPGEGLGFTIIDAGERGKVEHAQRKIEALGLSAGQTQFLTAYLYRVHGLQSEAILKLEASFKTLKEPAVARSLGDSYLQVGLIRNAEQAYLNSLGMSPSGVDEEGQMMAHLRLGSDIYRSTLGNKAAAKLHLNSALALAKKIGDFEIASQAERALGELNPDPGRDEETSDRGQGHR